ncbi:hypothetical protein D3C80_1787790 [compost metagenome]
MPGGLVAGLVEDFGIGVGAQHFLDAHVVVDEEMPWHVQHRQGIAGPDTGFAVDFDRQLRGDLGHGNLTPEIFASVVAAALTPALSPRERGRIGGGLK